MRLLRHRRYQYYLSSSVLVFGSRWMLTVVTGWVVLELTDSAFMVGLANSMQWLPMLFMGTFIGLIADKINRRKLLIFAQIAHGLICVLIGLLVISDLVQTWHIIFGSLVIGFAWAIDFPNRRAMIPDLIGIESVHSAISMDVAVMALMSGIGAISGGQLIPLIGAGECFLVIGFLFVLASMLLFLIGQVSQAIPLGGGSFLGDIVLGIQYVINNKAILAVLVITIVLNMLAFPYRHILPVFARDILAIGPEGLGYLTGVAGIGAFISSIVLANLGSIKRPGIAFLSGSFGVGAFLIIFASSTNYLFSLLALIVHGLCMAFFGAFQSTILLKITSEEMRGRVMGILSLCVGTQPVGIMVFGALADNVGAPWVVGTAALLASVLILTLFYTIPSLRRLP
jgi:MFS family permease